MRPLFSASRDEGGADPEGAEEGAGGFGNGLVEDGADGDEVPEVARVERVAAGLTGGVETGVAVGEAEADGSLAALAVLKEDIGVAGAEGGEAEAKAAGAAERSGAVEVGILAEMLTKALVWLAVAPAPAAPSVRPLSCVPRVSVASVVSVSMRPEKVAPLTVTALGFVPLVQEVE